MILKNEHDYEHDGWKNRIMIQFCANVYRKSEEIYLIRSTDSLWYRCTTINLKRLACIKALLCTLSCSLNRSLLSRNPESTRCSITILRHLIWSWICHPHLRYYHFRLVESLVLAHFHLHKVLHHTWIEMLAIFAVNWMLLLRIYKKLFGLLRLYRCRRTVWNHCLATQWLVCICSGFGNSLKAQSIVSWQTRLFIGT